MGAGLVVQFKGMFDGFDLGEGDLVEGAFGEGGDVAELNLVFEECVDGDFIGRVEGEAGVLALINYAAT